MPQQPSPDSARGDAALARALALVRDLRARCPWDHAQTRETLRPYLVEEALELDQALKDGEPAELRDELGDLLLHLAFQIVIGEERRELDAETVTRARSKRRCGGGIRSYSVTRRSRITRGGSGSKNGSGEQGAGPSAVSHSPCPHC